MTDHQTTLADDARAALHFHRRAAHPALRALRDVLLDEEQPDPGTALEVARVLLAAHTAEVTAATTTRRRRSQPTASTITDDELDALIAERDQAISDLAAERRMHMAQSITAEHATAERRAAEAEARATEHETTAARYAAGDQRQ